MAVHRTQDIPTKSPLELEEENRVLHAQVEDLTSKVQVLQSQLDEIQEPLKPPRKMPVGKIGRFPK